MLSSLSKSATATLLNWSGLALLIFAAVLVVGLVGEYLRLKSAGWNPRERFFSAWLVIGVCGELIANGAIFALEHHLQNITIREIAILNDRAEGFRLKADALEAQLASATNNLSTVDPKNRPATSVKAYLFWSIENPSLTTAPDLSGAVGFIWITPYSYLTVRLDKIETTQSGPWIGYTAVFSGRATQDPPKSSAPMGYSAFDAMQRMERVDISIGTLPITNQVVYVSSLQLVFNGRVEREFHPIRSEIGAGSWTMHIIPTTNDAVRVGSW